jgi:hypothetical protein
MARALGREKTIFHRHSSGATIERHAPKARIWINTQWEVKLEDFQVV